MKGGVNSSPEHFNKVSCKRDLPHTSRICSAALEDKAHFLPTVRLKRWISPPSQWVNFVSHRTTNKDAVSFELRDHCTVIGNTTKYDIFCHPRRNIKLFFLVSSGIFLEADYSFYQLLISSKGKFWQFQDFSSFPVSQNTPICMSKQTLQSPAARNERSPYL